MDSDNHKKICENDVTLKKLDQKNKFSNFDISYDTPLKPNQLMKLVNLIRQKPMMNFILVNKNFEGLWDTSSMLSPVNLDWLKTEFNDIQTNSIKKFEGDESPNVTLRTANITRNENYRNSDFCESQIGKINLRYHLLSEVKI